MRRWNSRPIKAVLLDVTGVLYDCSQFGDGTAIAGSVAALSRLKASGLPYKLLTNQTSHSVAGFAALLQRHGFDVEGGDIICPCPFAVKLLKERDLRPHLLVHPDVVGEFDSVEKTDPSCVLLGDAAQAFTYDALNKAFRCLLGMSKPTLLALGNGRYYKDNNELVLDVGAYTKALEYACGATAEVIGKPTRAFYNHALREVGTTAAETLMVGDDIVTDIAGAQACGMPAVLVRTGKYRPEDEPHASIVPDGYGDDFSAVVGQLLNTDA